eukprot:1647947-Amphidinium_carterae.1
MEKMRTPLGKISGFHNVIQLVLRMNCVYCLSVGSVPITSTTIQVDQAITKATKEFQTLN